MRKVKHVYAEWVRLREREGDAEITDESESIKFANAFMFELLATEPTRLMRERTVKSNESIFAVLNEMNNKWRAFANRTSGAFEMDAYVKISKNHYADIHAYWLASPQRPVIS